MPFVLPAFYFASHSYCDLSKGEIIEIESCTSLAWNMNVFLFYKYQSIHSFKIYLSYSERGCLYNNEKYMDPNFMIYLKRDILKKYLHTNK